MFYTTYNLPTRNMLLQTNRNNPPHKITFQAKLIRRKIKFIKPSLYSYKGADPACHLFRTKPIHRAQFFLRFVEIRSENFDGDPASKRLGVLINRTMSSDPAFRETNESGRSGIIPGWTRAWQRRKTGTAGEQG